MSRPWTELLRSIIGLIPGEPPRHYPPASIRCQRARASGRGCGGVVNSMHPYARNETFLLSFMLNVYEPLVRRDKELKLEPALATEWSQTAPDVWRFKLRQGVKFHDGTPFVADDVIFSYERAKG